MNMKKIIYILLTLTLFTSCLYEAMYFLTDKDLEWMAPYEKGDTILFQSSNGMDTMTIDEITLYNDDNPWRENEGTSVFNGNSTVKYTILHSGEVVDGVFSIYKKDSIKLCVHLDFNWRRFGIDDERELQFCSMNVAGAQYDDAIRIGDSNSVLYGKSPNNAEYLYWSKSKGLLQYKYLNGEVYTFYKKLPDRK